MNWDQLRREMVDTQLRARGIIDPRVLDAANRIPRELFVDPAFRTQAYSDNPLSIHFGQTISQPYMTALMAQMLELRGHELVLDVGTGSGYHAAVLGLLCRRLVSIERIPELAAIARANLRECGLDANVVIVVGDGSAGYAPLAPFDAISVAAGAPEIPQALIDQLSDPGRLIIPVGTLDEQDLWVVDKVDDEVTRRRASGCRFVPLRGTGGWRYPED